MIVWGYIGALVYGILCLLLSMVVYKLGVPKKYTRKIVHILIGAEWFILHHTVGASIHFIIVCLIFTALIWVSYAKSLMPMISSDKDNAPGTVYFCISMTVMAVISYFVSDFALAFGMAVLCTSVGDGFACVIGNLITKCNPKIYKNKTLIGTVAAFLFSFVSLLLFSYFYELNLSIWQTASIALLASGLELVTAAGLDNITLPLGTSFFAYFLICNDGAGNYIIPIILTPFVIALASGKGLLTAKGILLAVLCDVVVSVALGNFGFVLLLAFLLLSVVIDKVKKHFAHGADEISKRGEQRDEIQVIANGIIPMVMAVLFLIFGHKAFVVGYCAALAECFADTSASGIGILSKKTFDVFKFKPVKPGLSGGMSLIGTLASLIAPFAFSLISIAFGALDWKSWLLCGIAAFIGAVFDSFLGSVAQAKFKCMTCGVVTEKNIHCGEPTEHVSGLKFVGNDLVNVASSGFSAILAIVFFLL